MSKHERKEVENGQDLYELSTLIGEGKFSRLFKAKRLIDSLICTIKICPLYTKPNKEIEKEIKHLQSCNNHRNIIHIYDIFFSKKKQELWIILEFCESDILKIIKKIKRTLKEKEIKCIVKSTLLGLKYLHFKKSRIHRDIKASNICVQENGDIKIIDFGICCKIHKNKNKHTEDFLGSPYWMAPEVIDPNEEYDCRADIYSLGATIIEMAEGRPPNWELEKLVACSKIPTQKKPRLKEREKWSDEMNEFLSLCLEKNPKKRLNSKELLKHDFVQSAKSKEPLRLLVKKYLNKVGKSKK